MTFSPTGAQVLSNLSDVFDLEILGTVRQLAGNYKR